MKVEEKQLDINYDRSLAEFLQEEAEVRELRPDGFGITVEEFMKLRSTTKTAARNSLNELVEKGILKKKYMVMPGKQGSNPYVYYRPEGEE